ncbi:MULTISPECIES: LysR family transcriptional regulator [Paraburkholderia]|uniref:DNA-binding transcriptional LysR family regulator n=1 Tax=Paraburkholderia tropica TaxID=92647 RepID=A0A1A5X445_9BURK|nr:MULTISPECIES: LysR family transcriptional regulator [Paraburkholderia]MBB2980830.1 DNA-binding transcriptional LysR family regulator [Paraburkholderia tropica]MBB3002316.1 DNA-binding transcriptional LysR family regulator [Paraburkholderia tropica]MBB6321704.1 DNA-binding transcriptional LysR family regulator [Paraburkholderia tropica]MDE1140210.1 LysR family transcriptional regulator [Paraburkholderia tropica]OBR48104.1 LysR family transcriptional regulator [Paraburkholderia tropica]
MDSRSGEMRVFTRVVETGSFSAAGKTLELTPSAVSKVISRLEERLGVLLFQRSTRHLAVTNEGRLFYDSCVRILDDIDEAEHGIAEGITAPHGALRINVSIPMGTHYIVPLMPLFTARYPGIRVDLSLTDAVVDLQRERVDVAVRTGPLSDANFHARKLGSTGRAVVAAPRYLEAHGVPQAPEDLAGHRCFNFNFRRAMDEWPFRIDGRVFHFPVRGDILTNNGATMRQMTLEGLGISRLGLFHIKDDLASGRLVELLPDYNPGDIEDIHVIFSNQRHMTARVRVFIDFLVETLSPRLEA